MTVPTNTSTVQKPFKVVLLNAVVPPPFDGIINVNHITLQGAREIIRMSEKIESYIGHEATASLLSNVLGVNVALNRSMYTPQDGDIALVFRLKKRLEKPGDINDIKPEDIEVLLLSYRTRTTNPPVYP